MCFLEVQTSFLEIEKWFLIFSFQGILSTQRISKAVIAATAAAQTWKKQQKKQQENSKNILEGGRGKTKRKGRGCPGGGAVQEEGSFWGGGWTGVWGGANRGKHTRSQTHGHHMHAHRMQPHTHHTPHQSWEWHGKKQFWLRWRRGSGGRHFTLRTSIGIEMAWSVVNSCCWRCVNYETSQMGYCHCCRACRGLIFDEQIPPTRKFQLGFRQQIATKEFWDSLSVRILKVALSTTTF